MEFDKPGGNGHDDDHADAEISAEKKSRLHYCGNCQKETVFTPWISVVLLFCPKLDRPYPLIPAEDYAACTNSCGALFDLVSKAQESHETTRIAGDWTRAVIIFIDGTGADIKTKGKEFVGQA